ncbi:head-tail connector protein [Rhizorhabdus histidinilytica]|uniref:head-tail connector protein n=1 Tax=Rhizorhabdus histidinilytica TaxID=439228 RepID=UPI0032204FAD
MAEPVSLELARAHLNADEGDDLVINSCIASARGWVENYTGQILAPRRVSEAIDRFTDPLVTWPIASIYEITYADANRSRVPLSPDVYDIANVRRPARLTLNSGQAWPRVAAGPGQIIVDVDAGYDTPADIPPGMIRAMLMLISGYYVDRETGGLASEIETAARLACGAAARGWRL